MEGSGIGMQLVASATSAMGGGVEAIVAVGAISLSLVGALKLLHIIKSALGR